MRITCDNVNTIKNMLNKPPVFSALNPQHLLHLEGGNFKKPQRKKLRKRPASKEEDVKKQHSSTMSSKHWRQISPVTNSLNLHISLWMRIRPGIADATFFLSLLLDWGRS